MKLIGPILLNCILVLAVYLTDKHTIARKMPRIGKQTIIGLLFGVLSAFSSEFGVDIMDTTINLRDAAPLTAGLVFGAPAGIISGLIGGLYRWFSVYWGAGAYTQLACTIATILAGVMAAASRKLMFDDKKPTWGYGICISVVCEVVHMLLIFLTNMNDSHQAFALVRNASIPMIVGNALAVGCSIIIVSLLSRERLTRRKGSERIAQTFQRWLLACIVVAYLITSIFTYSLQNGMAQIQTHEMFSSAVDDVEADVRQKSDTQLLSIAQSVRREYEKDPNIPLRALAARYGIKEINVVREDGVIINSTEEDVINSYNMNSKAQSKEFMDVLKTQDTFVQAYSPRGKDESVWRKYAAVNLSKGGFIQVGYDPDQFYSKLDAFVIDMTRNRHVGSNGFVAVCDDELRMVSANKELVGNYITVLGMEPPEEMQNRVTATKMHTAVLKNINTGQMEEHIFVFKFVEGYCIMAAMPKEEAMFMRDASLYTSMFMQVLIFASLFVFIYILIKKVIINNLKKINDTLGQITEGNLNVKVNVRTTQEFASLSDDINTTVATLKRYIADAAARIDKELEYAKQIQLSALPSNFPQKQDYKIYAQMIAAKEVGGDFYDFYQLEENKVVVLAADVSGKGIPAAMFMMTAKTILKDLAESGMAVNDIFTKANEKLCENNQSGMFVTAWMGILDVTTGEMEFANAGHNPPLLKRADGSFTYLRSRAGFVLAGMEGICYRVNTLTLQPGDRLFLYTDGVTEATDVQGGLYGEDRLQQFMDHNSATEAVQLLPALKGDIDGFVGEAPQFDDITMLMLDFKPQPPKVRVEKSFPAQTQALPEVLEMVETQLEQFDCSMKLQTGICVAIEEVFVNVANYAYPEGGGQVSLQLQFDPQTRTVTFDMVDRGIPFDPLKKPDPDITLAADDRQIGGLGIFITKKTMDSVTYAYENGENRLTMTKKI